ncbi:MAG: MBL fold metallo-hydrolase [Dehalococcoidia bacterium]
MELEVIGCATTAPTGVDVCSSYLVRHDGVTLLLDCGPGAVHRLQERRSLIDLTAIIITHMHSDHCLDLVPAAGRLLIQRRIEGAEGKTRLLAPPGGREVLANLMGVFSQFGTGIMHRSMDHAFAIEEYQQPGTVEIGPMRVRFSEPLKHEAPCSAIRVEVEGRSVCYSGDTAPCDAITRHARGADLFLCEATYPRRPADRPYLHLSPEEAGEIAAAAGVGNLVLTHFARSDAQWKQAMRERAQQSFGSPVGTASRGLVVQV